MHAVSLPHMSLLALPRYTVVRSERYAGGCRDDSYQSHSCGYARLIVSMLLGMRPTVATMGAERVFMHDPCYLAMGLAANGGCSVMQVAEGWGVLFTCYLAVASVAKIAVVVVEEEDIVVVVVACL